MKASWVIVIIHFIASGSFGEYGVFNRLTFGHCWSGGVVGLV